MRIIDNKKDYYDYLMGVFGIDPLAVYDRRKSNIITSNDPCFEYLFPGILKDYRINDYHEISDRIPSKSWGLYYDTNEDKIKNKDGYSITGDYYGTQLLVGNKIYKILTERFLDDKESPVVNSYYLGKTEIDIETRKNYTTENIPLCIVGCYSIWDVEKISKVTILKRYKIENPILRETPIPSLIKPEDLFNDIYNYLLSIKDKPIKDNRTDIEKLQSAGFDKKTSFRNM